MTKKIAIILLILVFLISGVRLLPEIQQYFAGKQVHEKIINIIQETKKEESFTQESWRLLKGENADFVFFLDFGNGIIQEPVVASENDEEYLYYDFYGNYNEEGTIFLDQFASENSQNVSLYGHNVYYDASRKFSPLENLMNEDYYQKNKFVELYLKNGEKKRYKIVYLYTLGIDEEEDYDPAKANFSNEIEFEEFMRIPRERNVLNNNQEIEYFDHFLTLQTCLKWNQDVHIVVLAKLVNVSKY